MPFYRLFLFGENTDLPNKMQMFGHFLGIATPSECQSIGAIINYNEASLECRVNVDIKSSQETSEKRCRIEIDPKQPLSQLWGYVTTQESCETVCLYLEGCLSFRNDTGCILYSIESKFANSTTSQVYTKSCEPPQDPKSDTKNTTTPNSDSRNITSIIAVCVVGGVLLLFIIFFICLHRYRLKKNPELLYSSKKSSEGSEATPNDTAAFISESNLTTERTSLQSMHEFLQAHRNRSGPV